MMRRLPALALRGTIAVTLPYAALAGCVDGAPKPELGAARFNTGTRALGGSAVAPRDEGPVSTAGSSSLPAQPEAAGASGGAAGAAPAANAGGSGGNGTAPTLGGSGGMAGRATQNAGGAGQDGAAGRMGGAGMESSAAPVSAGTLTIAFTSVNQGGRYAPRNVGAVWIETSAGMFVKTIERWAGIRANHLTRWAQASGGWGGFFGGGNTADRMDAISRATLARHEKHMLTWDMKDLQGQIVADGKYKVGIEVTEDNFTPGANTLVEFDKGAAAQTVMPPDREPYSGLIITYQP